MMARKRRWQARAGFQELQHVFLHKGPQHLLSARQTVPRRRGNVFAPHHASQRPDSGRAHGGGHDAGIRPKNGEEARTTSKRVPRPGGRAHRPGLPDGSVDHGSPVARATSPGQVRHADIGN